MSIDLFASVRSTALITLVAASFTSPIVLKSDAFADASARLSGAAAAPTTERVVAGGVEFAMPLAWDALGSTAASSGIAATRASERIGTIVSGLCPGGSAGSACTDGVRITFVSYTGGDDHELPALTSFHDQLDARLAREFRGFEPTEVRMRSGQDGIRYLDYAFTWREGKAVRRQRIAAFRHEDGSGVVALATGAKLEQRSAAIDEVLASSHKPASTRH